MIYRDTDTIESERPKTTKPAMLAKEVKEKQTSPLLTSAQETTLPVAQLFVNEDGRAQIVFGIDKATPLSTTTNSSINYIKRAVRGNSSSSVSSRPLSPKKSAINWMPAPKGLVGPRDALKKHILSPPPPQAFIVPHTHKNGHMLVSNCSNNENYRNNSISKTAPTATAVRSRLDSSNNARAVTGTATTPNNDKINSSIAAATVATIMNEHCNGDLPTSAATSASTTNNFTTASTRTNINKPDTTSNNIVTETHSTANTRLKLQPLSQPQKRKPSLAFALAQATRKHRLARLLQKKRREQRLDSGSSEGFPLMPSSSSSSSSSSDERGGQIKNGFEEEEEEELNIDDESSDSEEGQEGIIEGLLALRDGNWR